MSGTSLDGLDLALCEFRYDDADTLKSFKIVHAETLPYDAERKDTLLKLMQADAEEITHADFEFGHFIGESVRKFLIGNNQLGDFIASHGHTVFHRPEEGYTLQIGHGAAVAAAAGLPTVCDFRSGDVRLGGQGAPLVPIGDELLFSEYDFCLNIGGIANISYEHEGRRIAFDVCPANMILNELAMRAGEEYDRDGIMARSGRVHEALLRKLGEVPYYKKSFPKSLGKEYVEMFFSPLLSDTGLSVENLLATCVEHTAIQIAETCRVVPKKENAALFVTGGGALNTFLTERIRYHTGGLNVIVPDMLTVQFKEALIFAFLGVLRIKNKNNCLTSVTGARRDSCGGALYLP